MTKPAIDPVLISPATPDEYASFQASITKSLEEKYSKEAFPEDPLSFEIFSSLRYDPLLTPQAPQTIDHVTERNFFLFDEHYNRLIFTLKYFNLQFHSSSDLDFDIPRKQLIDKLIEALKLSERPIDTAYKVRLLVKVDGSVRIEVHDAPERANLLDGLSEIYDGQDQGLPEFQDNAPWNVYLYKNPVLISPFTSFKTTNRKPYDEARKTLPGLRPGKEELLLRNSHGFLLEGSITNVAVRRKSDGSWITPQLSSGCLCGTVRHFLLRKNFVQEETVRWNDIEVGDDVLLFNGVIGVVRGKIVG